MELGVWLVFFSPLASFVLISFVIRPFLNHRARWAGHLTVLAVAISFVLSLWVLAAVLREGGPLEMRVYRWLQIGEFRFAVQLLVDPLTAIMLVVVTSVSLMVQVYSLGYMEGDPGFARYFAYMSLFTASMLGLVLANNIIQLFVFWELVGLCSYLLIGFWYHRPAAAAAAKKAFIVTRVGDFGFLLAILYLFANSRPLVDGGLDPFLFTDLYEAVGGEGRAALLGAGVATWVVAGAFAGAVGKSAQVPLHTWLPDAMEGPTPVSALIHAATMVAAGVFLVARFFPLLEHAGGDVMTAVALVGAVTAFVAASMGLVMNDIKRVLAYSTISQLGYMMMALGLGAYGPALFHLFTHAFFKALLFLGSGSVNHATGTFDMRYMGGLRKVMPWTYATFLIGGLSLAGIFPLAGFWSKDEILAGAWARGDTVALVAFWLGLAAAFMTAFYMFRALFMTFEGSFRGGAEADPEAAAHGPAHVHLAESPRVMVVPLVLLAAATAVVGWAVNPLTDLAVVPIHWFSEFLSEGPVHVEAEAFNVGLAVASSLVAVAGIGLAYAMYMRGAPAPETVGRLFRPAYVLLSRKYYFDDLYEGLVVGRLFYRGVAAAVDWFDRAIVDGVVNAVGWLGRNVGRGLARLQTGQVQAYGVAISVGVFVILAVYLIVTR